MKIIIIPHYPGKASRHYCLAEELIRQGHEIHYFSWAFPYRIRLKSLITHLFTSLIPDSYKDGGIFMHKAIRLPYFWPVVNGWIFKWQLRRLFKKLKADIIITESYTNETEVPKDLPFIYDLADDYAAPADVYGSFIYKLAFKLLGVRWIMQKHTKNALAVTVVSNILNQYAKKNNSHVYKLANGVDTELINNVKKNKSIQINRHSIIYVTAFNQWSRPIIAMEAVTFLRKEFPKLKLTLVGSGLETENIKRYIKETKAEKYIKYVGYIGNRNTIFNLINQHEIGLNTSVKNIFRDAAFPMKVIEYCALGKKVVSTDLDEVKRLNYPNIFIFSDKSKKNSLINTLRKALLDTRTDKDFSNVSEKVLNTYDWKKITSDLVGIIKKHKTSPVSNTRRIIHITPSYPPALGGLENVVQSLAREQYKSGQNVEVITTKPDESLQIEQEKFFISRLSSWIFASTKIIPEFIFELFKLNKHDIIHLHIISAFMPELVWLVSKIRGFKYIAHLHIELLPTTKAGLLLKIYKPMVLSHVLKSAAFVVVFSSDQKEKVREEYGIDSSNIAIIPNGVEDNFFVEKNRSMRIKPKLLFVGRLEVQKNISQLLRALKGISDKFETTLVGEGSLLNDLKQLAVNLKLSGVKFVGRADGKKLLNYYKQSDIFVLPSAREGMPLALLEATAMGLPIVATNVTGNREVLRNGENGILVPFGNSKMLGEALLKIRSDKKLYAKFSKGAKKIAKNYSWKKVAKEFDKLYGQLNNQTINKNLIAKNDNKKKDLNNISFKLWHILIPALIFSNFSYLLNNYFGTAITLLFILFVPGYLLLRIITYEIKSRWEVASFSLGLSLLLLMLGGLALNSLYQFGLEAPLTTQNIFIMLDVLTLVLLFFNRNKTIGLPKKYSLNFPLKNIFMFILLSILPFLAAGGAISLNNGGPNILTMILFGLIPVLFVILVWRKDMESMYPYAVFMMGLSILFTNSLRGWFITGHDIHHEYSVFMNTFNNNLWPVRLATGDPYNACLSITILPTILAKISAISTMYIYKFLFQVIFAFGLIPIYLFIKKYTSAIYGIMGAFIFITFPTFLNDMPFLNRQEIAFIFFGLLILTTFSELKKRPKLFLSITLLLGIMLSHYSSNYVTIALLILSWIGFIILKRIQRVKDNFDIPIARLWVIILALALSFVWNYQITRSASNLERSLVQTIEDFKYKRSVKDRFLSYGLFEKSTLDTRKQFEDFARKRGSSAKYVEPYELPLTPIGNAISPYVNVRNFNYGMHSFVAKIYQVLIILGIIVYYFRQKKLNLKKQTYFFIIGFSALALLVFFTVLPRLATDYSIIRLIQQTLILTALPIVFAGEFIFSFLRRFKIYIVGALFILIYYHSSGFIPQLTGGYKPQLPFNNTGSYYNFFYTESSDLLGTEWLGLNRDKNKPIFHDIASDLQSLKYWPQVGFIHNKKYNNLLSSAYIYLGNKNIKNNIIRTYQGGLIEYNHPSLTDNRSLIYNNMYSNIYTATKK